MNTFPDFLNNLQKIKKRLMYFSHMYKQQAFTLLELMVVVAVLAVVSASVIMNSASSREYSKEMAVRTEMEQLRQAVVAFFQDQNVYNAASPADCSFLLDEIGFNAWNPDYRTGWRGPYIKGGDVSFRTPFVTIGNDLGFDGSGSPLNGTIGRVMSKPDPYTFPSDAAIFIWTVQDAPVSNTNPEIERLGQPYYFFDLNTYNSATSIARIVSSGVNGVFENEGGDDLVLMI